jgi:hypothetical protein
VQLVVSRPQPFLFLEVIIIMRGLVRLGEDCAYIDSRAPFWSPEIGVVQMAITPQMLIFVSPESSGSEQQDNACVALLPKCRTEHEIERRLMTLFLHNYYKFHIVCF